MKVWKLYNPIFKYETMFDDLGGPWAGHKYFGYDLVRNLKPKKIVELGTHLGCSLFSLAQSIHDGKLNIQIDAIDTWQGDKHSSIYGENIFQRVQEIKRACYPKVNINFIRKTFDQASKKYPDNSIDILHIDGMHTYKMVKHDYATWINRVNKNGIIMLHDTAVKKWGFGVHKLFTEVKRKFKTIEFAHSYGLGVIFKNPKIYLKLQKIIPYLQSYYTLKAEKMQLEWDFNKQSLLIKNYKELPSDYKKQLELYKSQITEYKSQLDCIQSAKTYKVWQLYNRLFKYKIWE